MAYAIQAVAAGCGVAHGMRCEDEDEHAGLRQLLLDAPREGVSRRDEFPVVAKVEFVAEVALEGFHAISAISASVAQEYPWLAGLCFCRRNHALPPR